jgi:hypothetical protein
VEVRKRKYLLVRIYFGSLAGALRYPFHLFFSRPMPKLSTSLRLLLLAAATSFALTSCFDHDKKDAPRPKGSCGTKTTTTSSSGTN